MLLYCPRTLLVLLNSVTLREVNFTFYLTDSRKSIKSNYVTIKYRMLMTIMNGSKGEKNLDTASIFAVSR